MDKKTYNYYYGLLKTISYEKQDHWDIFDSVYYDKIKNMDSLLNFRNNGISNMLETGLPSQERFELIKKNDNYNINYNQIEIKEILKRYNYLKKMIGGEVENIPFNTNAGNPRHYAHDNKLLNFDDLYHIYATWQINRFIKLENSIIKTVVEIGAGYGNFSHKFKTTNNNIKYIIIDLPEILLLQHYYLLANNNSYKIINLIDYKNKDIDIDNTDCDFILIPFNMYKNYNFKCDIIINKRSLGEMPKIILNDYFVWIQKNLKKDGLFYLVNRYAFTKSTDKNKLKDYPFDNNWEVILSQPQWLQTHLHEFLLKRNFNNKINITELLKSFPDETPPSGPIMDSNILDQKDWLKHQNITK